MDKAKLTGSFDVLKRRKGALVEERDARRNRTPGSGTLSADFRKDRLRPGDLVSGRYEIRSEIGRGPAGTVYRALDQEIDDDVALKVIHKDVLADDKAKETFVRVLRKARRLSQQNIVRVYDVEWDRDEDRVHYTSQYLEGLTLRKVLELRRDRGQFFALREVEPIISQVCLALQHAHKGAAHGGLKPSNIVILPDFLKITDFYMAEALGQDLFIRLQDEHELGEYVAPELRDGRSGDARSDLFSLGSMLTEMLCGAPLLDAGERPSSRNPDLRAAEDELHARAAAAEPEERYRTAEEFSEDVTSVIDTGGVIHGEDLGDGASLGGAAESMHLEGGTLVDEEDPSTGYTDPNVVIEEIRPASLPPADAIDPDTAVDVPTASEDAPDLAPHPDTDTGPVLFDDSAHRPAGGRMHRNIPQGDAAPRPTGPTSRDEDMPVLPVAMLILVVIAALAYGAIQLLKDAPPPGGVVAVSQPVGPGGDDAPHPRSPSGKAGDLDSGGSVAAEPDAGVAAAEPALGAAASPAAAVANATTGPGREPPVTSDLVARAEVEPLVPASPAPPVASPVTAPPSVAPLAVAPSDPAVAGATAPTAPAKVAPPTPVPPPKPVPPPTPVAPPTPVPPPPPIRLPPPAPVAPVTPKVAATPAPPSIPTPPPVATPRAEPAKPAAKKLSKCPGGMSKIKKGRSRIGSSKRDSYRGFEGVERRVEVDAFCVDRFEYPGKGRPPLVGVTYDQAKALCGARGLRLCSDTEWERACKGPRGRRYPYGNTFNANHCVTEDRSEEPRSLQPTGSFKRCKSGYGTYDMSGNAAEWTVEGHLRGGTATKPDYAVRCAHKVKKNKSAKDPFVGFRCCADAK